MKYKVVKKLKDNMYVVHTEQKDFEGYKIVSQEELSSGDIEWEGYNIEKEWEEQIKKTSKKEVKNDSKRRTDRRLP